MHLAVRPDLQAIASVCGDPISEKRYR